ncbi:AAA family ATPase [Streptomyces sp. NPDC059690]|uniref:AAA family ATPase n=1 Tax=Streptomyces sp. NPDC059690 TaxID=3346907 RepID=UPI0036775674
MTPPDDWRSHYEQGIEALRAARLEDARALFDKAVAAGADRWEAYYARAWATLKSQDGGGESRLRAAESDLARAVGEFGAGADATALRGEIARRRGDDEQALRHYLHALGRSSMPEFVEEQVCDVLSDLLEELEEQPDTEAALERCERLVLLVQAAPLLPQRADELLAEVIATRAHCHRSAGHQDAYQEDVDTVARLVPEHPMAAAGNARTGSTGAAPPKSVPTEPTFAAVGGLDHPGSFMGTVKQLFETYFATPDIAALRRKLEEYGQTPTQSLLMFGPSGCGKTHIIRALAGEYRARHHLDLPIVRIRLNEVLNRYVGDDQKALTNLIDQVIDVQPAILFADEVDAIGMSREDSQDWRIHLAAHWIQEVDRLRESGASVLFFGCTNRIWAIDPAMLRRFDQMLPVELPGPEVRSQVFELYINRLSTRVRPETVDLKLLAERSHGLTPGDIQQVVSRASQDLLGRGDGAERLTQEALLRVLRARSQPMHVQEWVRQSVSALRTNHLDAMAEQVERTYGPFVADFDALTQDVGPGAPAWRSVPEDAWTEQPHFDLSLMREIRR